MNRQLRLGFAVVIVGGTAALGTSGDARTAPPALAVTRSTLPDQRTWVRRPQARRALHRKAYVSTPPGCATNGVSSFVGGGFGNVAGGSTAGVVDGSDNRACEGASGILDGVGNVIGGDGSSPYSVIVGGVSGAIENAQNAFIGSGNANALGYDGTPDRYANANYSAIVGGQQNTVESPLSFIGAGTGNVIDAFLFDNGPGGQSAFIGAGNANSVGGTDSGIVSGSGNSVEADDSTIAGGLSNSIPNAVTQGATGSEVSFIGGGQGNTIGTSLSPNDFGFNSIVGGESNTINGAGPGHGSGFNVISGGLGNTAGVGGATGDEEYSVIGGGSSNSLNGAYVTIAGGNSNAALMNGATIGGGSQNKINGAYAVIAGGYQNTASGGYSTISGGHVNSATGVTAQVLGGYGNTASGQNSTVVGGANNVAGGLDSFAAGRNAQALNNGTFVWSDASGGKLTSTATNQFLARASGGYALYSNPTLTTGVALASGSGSWSSVSDRRVKTAIVSVDEARILQKVASLPVSEWSYLAQGTGVRHLGPMAQDFRAAFGLGEDDRHIATIDEDGVALAAIKALQAEIGDRDRRLAALRRADDAKLAAIEARLARLERGDGPHHSNASAGVRAR